MDSGARLPSMSAAPSICLGCGACCSHFRVTFLRHEALERGIDENSLERVSPWHVCFKGTGGVPARCIHLDGAVGACVSCRIYGERPAPCRRLEPGDDKCRRARAVHGLEPVSGGMTSP